MFHISIAVFYCMSPIFEYETLKSAYKYMILYQKAFKKYLCTIQMLNMYTIVDSNSTHRVWT